MEIGKLIKEARKKSGLTQKQLGEKLNVSQAMIGQYENGIRKPKFETIIKIAQALDVQVESLIDSVSIAPMTEDDQKYFEYCETSKKNIHNENIAKGENTSYFYPEGMKEILRFFEKNPEYLELLHASRNVRREDVKLAIQILEKLKEDK